ncbi:MAG: dTDP-4-amino-4,6-dideoxygalactose transaminase, partial [Saprospiraceae bacterium]|nr:dTDP-4-amino-4,6-dideoxygalactose transaminase [Saprospiraceae bacterium]
MSERKPIPFNLPLLTGAEETYLREALHQGHFAGDGPHSHRCATYLEKLTGARKVLPTPSCTHALELAALLIDLKPGDEVILPSFTFVSTANAFALRGARLVFVDIDPRTMNIDPNEVEQAIGPRTRAVLAMHYAGIGCDLKALKDLADRHGLFLIEDAAHCIDAYSGDRHLGAIGHLGALSFHESKNIHCGEGGALLVNDPELVERAIVMREKGTNRAAFAAGKTPFYSWVDLGSSYSLGELPAAFLFAQTRALPGVTARRLQLWRLYQEALRELADTGELELPFAPAEARHN